ncbi:MAG: HAMP domain-containing sensor histidine kinase [Gemmatimonadales bacterium]|jgi:signal transduction histidine kinase
MARLKFLRPSIPGQRRGTPLVALLLLILGLSAVLAYEALDAARSHRQTAEATLNDYADVVAWEYSRRSREALDYALFEMLWPAVKMPPVRPEQELRPIEDVVAEVAKHSCAGCPWVHGVDFHFRVDLASGDVVTWPEEPSDWIRAWLADTVRHAVADTDAMRAEHSTVLLVGPFAGRSDVIAFTVVAGTGGTARAAYGLHADFAGLKQLFREWGGTRPLLPPAIAHAKPNDSLVAIQVVTADGRPVYQSPVAYAPRYTAADTLGRQFGALTVHATLRPEVASNLVIGGLPGSRIPLLMGLLVLTAAVGVAALYQLRRERELARLRDDFVSGVSHELRTPLAQIRMFAELLELDRLRSDGERGRAKRVINQEARRLSHLVENVLHFSRVRRGTAQLSKEAVDIPALLDEVVDAFRPLAQAAEVTVRSRVEERIVASIDRGAVCQMVLNLLDNAVKYGPAGQTVSLETKLVSERVRISVEDQGQGIPPEERERIWEPYRRLERNVITAGGGTGIGLAVVRELARLHGGDAWIEDGAAGARFVIELPDAWEEATRITGEFAASAPAKDSTA